MTAPATTEQTPTQHPWDMDLTEAKEMMITIMRENAETPEEVEVYSQLGTMVRMGWIEHVLRQQKNAHLREQAKVETATKRETKEIQNG